MLALDEKKFETEVSQYNGYVFVDYWSPACGPCNMLAPTFNSLETEYEGKVKFAKLNTDQSADLCLAQQVSALPTLILYKDGVEVSRILGLRPAQAIRDFLNKNLSN